MKYPVFAVRDIKTCFYPPQVNQNEEDAIRGYAMMFNNPSGVIGFAPKDFDLYKIGTFDTTKGVIEPLAKECKENDCAVRIYICEKT